MNGSCEFLKLFEDFVLWEGTLQEVWNWVKNLDHNSFYKKCPCRIANARIPKASGFGAGRHEALSHEVCELVHGAPFEGGTR